MNAVTSISSGESGGAVSTRSRPSPLVPLVLLAVLCWAFWPVLFQLGKDWYQDPEYSIGMLVVPAAGYMLFHDRERLRRVVIRPGWAGLALMGFGLGVIAWGLADLRESVERYGVLFTLGGAVLLVGGFAFFRWVFWIWAFLFMMVPLPLTVHNAISAPLQGLAADGAVVVLELMGVVVTQQNHVLVLNHQTPVAVAEACSGLRMLTAFVVVSAVLAYVVPRPRWQKVVLLLSSVPVAVLSNVIRLVVTSLLFMVSTSSMVMTFSHDFAGLAMMPLALAMLSGELWIMSRMVEVDEDERVPSHV